MLLNYVCPPALLEPLVPAGTELDTWDDHTVVSLVGFLFADTRRVHPLPFITGTNCDQIDRSVGSVSLAPAHRTLVCRYFRIHPAGNASTCDSVRLKLRGRTDDESSGR